MTELDKYIKKIKDDASQYESELYSFFKGKEITSVLSALAEVCGRVLREDDASPETKHLTYGYFITILHRSLNSKDKDE